jgi:hypothetical protein
MNRYYIINWATDEAITSFESKEDAKKYCKSLGHTGEYKPNVYKGYPPIAWVGKWDNDTLQMVCVYNPRFRYQ